MSDPPPPPPQESPPRVLFVESWGWGMAFSEIWYEEHRIPMSVVRSYKKVPFEELGHYRIAIVNTCSWIDEDGNHIPSAMIADSPIAGPPPVPFHPDCDSFCSNLVSRMRSCNPGLIIVVMNGGSLSDDSKYLAAGADYVFRLSCGTIEELFPKFLKNLLESAGGQKAAADTA